jgi:transposase
MVAARVGRHACNLGKALGDGGHRGARFRGGLANFLPDLAIEIVRRRDHAKGFVALPRRWMVERTLARRNHSRRLPKDWQNFSRKGLVFLRLASIRLMLGKLCIPPNVLRQTVRAGRKLARCLRGL